MGPLNGRIPFTTCAHSGTGREQHSSFQGRWKEPGGQMVLASCAAQALTSYVTLGTFLTSPNPGLFIHNRAPTRLPGLPNEVHRLEA